MMVRQTVDPVSRLSHCSSRLRPWSLSRCRPVHSGSRALRARERLPAHHLRHVV